MERQERWMKILFYILTHVGATQQEISEATGISRSRICGDLRELGMWYHKYVKCEGRPMRYSLTVVGRLVAQNSKPLYISDRTRSRHLG